jgi:hypothetical protein
MAMPYVTRKAPEMQRTEFRQIQLKQVSLTHASVKTVQAHTVLQCTHSSPALVLRPDLSLKTGGK